MFAMRGELEIAKELLDSGAEVNAQDKGFQTALMLAVYHNQDDLAQLLLSRGADPALKDENNRTALMMAKYYKYDKIVAILQETDTK
jgi:ankyrin repeat protein